MNGKVYSLNEHERDERNWHSLTNVAKFVLYTFIFVILKASAGKPHVMSEILWVNTSFVYKTTANCRIRCIDQLAATIGWHIETFQNKLKPLIILNVCATNIELTKGFIPWEKKVSHYRFFMKILTDNKCTIICTFFDGMKKCTCRRGN